MAMKIKTRKEVKDGIAGRTITGFEGIKTRNELPSEYLNNDPHTYLIIREESGKNTLTTPAGMDSPDLHVGLWYPEQNFKKVIHALHVAGNRLHEINQRIKKLKEEWQGEETFII